MRGHAELLLPDAQAVVGRLWRGSVEWWNASRRVDNIRDRLCTAPSGELATHVQVMQLARDCEWLLARAQEQQENRP